METKLLDEQGVRAKGGQELGVGEGHTGRLEGTGAVLGLGKAIGAGVGGIVGGSGCQPGTRRRAMTSGGLGCTKERSVERGGCAEDVGGKLAEGNGMCSGRGGITGNKSAEIVLGPLGRAP